MGFILIDLKKIDEGKRLRELVRNTLKEFDTWVAQFPNDGTPPTRQECRDLSEAKGAELHKKFCDEADKLWRVKDTAEGEKKSVWRSLELKKYKLHQKFSAALEQLQDEAEEMMRFCVASLETKRQELLTVLPLGEEGLKEEFDEFLESMIDYVNNTFPDGLKGLDAYDNKLPSDVPNFANFKLIVAKEAEKMKVADNEAIPTAVDKIKSSSKDTFKIKINEAIQDAVKAIEEDLSDDVLPYLDTASMESLRKELIASAKEYGNSRLDK